MREEILAKTDLTSARELRIAGTPAIRLIWVVATYSLVALFFSPDLYLLNLKAFALDFLPVALTACSLGLIGTAVLRRPASPLSFLAEILAARGLGAMTITLGTCVGIAAFWTFKYNITRLVPFYADRTLANIDFALHFGDPWRWLHAVTPPAAIPALVLLYFPAWLFQFFTAIIVAAFCREPLRTRYMVAFTITMIGLGTVMATAVASAGPIFYDTFVPGGGLRFADLRAALGSSSAALPMVEVASRLRNAYEYGAENVFAGISAMPSIHVAVAALNALFFSRINRWIGAAAWVFAALTLFGSVYWGWHYAIDGYVAIAAVVSIWVASARMCGGDSV
ncbi:hypothetical protein HB777_20105 [Mesorhizobium loti]|nr:hypothetical protein HB777_20105 [Mesorhizobium loti]